MSRFTETQFDFEPFCSNSRRGQAPEGGERALFLKFPEKTALWQSSTAFDFHRRQDSQQEYQEKQHKNQPKEESHKGLPDSEFSIQDLSKDWDFSGDLFAPTLDNVFFSSMLNGEGHTNQVPLGGTAAAGLSAPVVPTVVLPAEEEPSEDDGIADSTNTTISLTIIKNAHDTNYATPPDQARQHACPQCTTRFSVAKDRDRHLRTVHHLIAPDNDIWVCHVTPCKRKGKPFSRRDNYLKHLRRVHKVEEEDAMVHVNSNKTSRPRQESSSKENVGGSGGESTSGEEANGLTERVNHNYRRVKRKSDVLEEDGLKDLARDELLELVLEMRTRCRKLEEEMQVHTRRHLAREDMWLKLLSDGLGKDRR